MLNTCHSYGKELTTGFVMNNNHGPYGPDDTKCAAPVPGGHALAKPADTVIFHMREFFSERPRRVLFTCLEDMDTDNNGKLAFDEFERGLRALNFDLSEADLRAVFNKLDSSGDGTIDRKELFLELHLQPDFSHDQSRFIRSGIGKSYMPSNHDPPSKGMINTAVGTMSSGYRHCVRQTSVVGLTAGDSESADGARFGPNIARPRTALHRLEPHRPDPETFEDMRDQTLAVLRNFFGIRTSTAQWNLFQDMDVDNSGFMCFGEFERALHALNLRLPSDQVKVLFDSFDHSGDGSISIGELREVIKQDAQTSIGREIGSETSSLAMSKPIEMCVNRYGFDASATDAADYFKGLQSKGSRPSSASWRRR